MKFSFNFNFGGESVEKEYEVPSWKYLAKKYLFTIDRFEKMVKKQNIRKQYPELADIPIEELYEMTLSDQEEMISDFFKYGSGTAMLLGARKYGKTESAIIEYCREVLKDPTETTLIIYTREVKRAKSLLKLARTILCGELGLDVLPIDNQTDLRVPGCKVKDNTITLLGIEGSGSRGRHPMYILMDDPVTPQACSEADRETVQILYDEAKKLTDDLYILGQSVHKEDLYAVLEHKVSCKRRFRGSIKCLDVDIEKEREDGVSERSIMSDYLGQLVASDDEPFADLTCNNTATFKPTTISQGILVIDPAFGGGDSCAFAFGVVVGDRYYCSLRASKKSIYKLGDYLLKYYPNVENIAIEVNKTSEVAVDFIKSIYNGRADVHSFYPNVNKIDRIENWISERRHKLTLLEAESDMWAIKEVLYWSHKAKHDDCPDALASLLTILDNGYN